MPSPFASFLSSLPLLLTFLTLNNVQGNLLHQPLKTNLPTPNEKLTKLHFYFHDIVSGANPTAIIVARPANTTSVGFGTLVMIDDPLTEGPETSSKVVGRAQGMYGVASQQGSSLLMTLTCAFTQGGYNGSSISILGRYSPNEAEREMPIIGGSGIFRLARGYALAKTYKYNPKTGDATSEYNVFVLHSQTSEM